MNVLLLFSALVFIQDPIAYKPSEEFDIKMNFEFKERTRPDPNRIELDQTMKERDRSRSGPLPYLYLNVRVLKQAEGEIRVRVIENGTKTVLNNKKFDMATVLKLDLGFTDDIKDRVTAYEYTVVFMNDNKDPVSRIVIYFQEDGTYLVNGQVRGKL